MKRKNRKFNLKGKRTLKKIGAWLLAILAFALACAGVFALFGGSIYPERNRNPDNLITIGEDSGYILTQDTNLGVKIDVKDDGTLKLSGKSTKAHTVCVQRILLPAGTYTLSGFDSKIDDCELYVLYGVDDKAISGTKSATFTTTVKQYVDVMISWSEGHSFNIFTGNTIRPLLVEGDSVGEFYF